MMKYLVILVLALFAMAAAQGVNVVDNNNPGNVNFVDNNPSSNNNPGNVNFVDNSNPGGVNFVDNNNPGNVNLNNPDPSFGRPTNPNYGGEPVDISPVYVNRPYPGKQYDNQYARGGK